MEDRYKSQHDFEAGQTAARAILANAKAEGRSLTGVERAKCNLHITKGEAFQTRQRAENLGGRGIESANGSGWKAVAERLSKGERDFSVPMSDVLGKAVSDANGAFEAATLRVEDGITQLPLDQRYIFNLFPQRDATGALHVSDFRQSARSLPESGTGVERDPLSTAEKQELDVAIDLASEDMRQLAVVIKDIPNALIENVEGLTAFLNAEMERQINAALDAHVVAAILASTPDVSAGSGASVAEELRFAKAELAAKGLRANIAILPPAELAALDVMPAIEKPGAFPYGLALAESPALDAGLLADTGVAGVLYRGQMRFAANPYTGFSKNTTDLRLECEALFIVRNEDGFMEIAGSGS